MSYQNTTSGSFGTNFGGYNPRESIGLVAMIAIVLLVLSGAFSAYFTVQPEEQAVVKRFGKVIAIREPGLHFKIPYGVDRVQLVPTARVLEEEFGFRTIGGSGRTNYQKGPQHRDESLMLTGDLKVIDVEWVVQYLASDPDRFLHGARDPRQILRDTSEAVMRRIVGNSLGSDVLTEKRVAVALQARKELQEILDELNVGIVISTLELQDVTPPELVKPAFNEVNQAEQERERLINEAEKRRNQIIPRAEGDARKIVAEAQGYALERVNAARGEAERFGAILAEYQNSPEVTRKRLYLEMIDEVLPGIGKLYVIDEQAGGTLPLLHLNETTQSAGGANP